MVYLLRLKDGNSRLELCEFVIVKGVILAKIECLYFIIIKLSCGR